MSFTPERCNYQEDFPKFRPRLGERSSENLSVFIAYPSSISLFFSYPLDSAQLPTRFGAPMTKDVRHTLAFPFFPLEKSRGIFFLFVYFSSRRHIPFLLQTFRMTKLRCNYNPPGCPQTSLPLGLSSRVPVFPRYYDICYGLDNEEVR